MKTIKNIFNILFACVAVVAFWACDDEVEYTPAENPTGDQVFFPSSLSESYDLATDATSFAIEVQRAVAENAINVPLTVTDESGKLSIPTSVDFAAGAKTATLTIGYNAADFDYDTYTSVELAIPDSYTTPYGNSAYAFTVGVPAPWTEWELYGTGMYTYTQYWSGDDPDRKVYKRTSKLEPTQSQFKIEGVFYGIDFIVDYNEETHECRISPQYTAYDNATYGPVYVADAEAYWVDVRQSAEATYDPSSFNPETGLFEFSLAFYVSAGYFGIGYEYLQLDGYEQPDYTLNLANAGHYVDTKGVDNAVVHIFKGADVASYKCILEEGALGASAIEKAIAGLVDGSIATDTLYVSGYKAFPLEAEGKYTAIAVGFDENDEVVNTASLTFEFMPVGMSDPWKSLGMCTFTEDCITTFWGVENLSYPVEIREHESKPGLYRLVSPYGAAYPNNEEGDYDATSEYFLEINAQDDKAVYVTLSKTGMDWGYGEISIWSMADYYMTNNGLSLENVKEQGFCGTLVDNVITFPANSLLISMTDYQGGGFYQANKNGAFKVDMTNLQPATRAMKSRTAFAVEKTLKSQAGAGLKNSTKYMRGINVDGKEIMNQRQLFVK